MEPYEITFITLAIPGDMVWVMHENKPHELKLVEVICSRTPVSSTVNYILFDLELDIDQEKIIRSDIYLTKESLLNSL